MMEKLSNTWSLMSASWQVLKKDKEILIFPLLSGICCLVVLASFAIPLFVTGSWRPPDDDATISQRILYYATLFLFYFINYLVIVFFNAAIIACAKIRLEGGDPTVSDGLRMAMDCLALIAGWALVAATVGLILRIIEDRVEKIGKLVAGLLGMAWTVTSFMVIPILVVEKKTPIAALKESTALLKKTWGEQLVGNVSFGLVFFLLAIPAFFLALIGAWVGSGPVVITFIGLAVIYFIGLTLIQSALQAIFQSALYLYARNGQVPTGFQPQLLRNALTKK